MSALVSWVGSLMSMGANCSDPDVRDPWAYPLACPVGRSDSLLGSTGARDDARDWTDPGLCRAASAARQRCDGYCGRASPLGQPGVSVVVLAGRAA